MVKTRSAAFYKCRDNSKVEGLQSAPTNRRERREFRKNQYMKKRIGFVGLGTMGLPMARNIVKAGYTVVGYDVVPQQLAAFEQSGGKRAASPKDVAVQSDVVITMLPESKHVEEAILGSEGIYAGLKAGGIHIDMSTIESSATKRFAAIAAESGIRMIDAPVGKSSAAAADGTLTLMVGADEATFKECYDILRTMGDTIHHCGDVGMGEVVKILNNLISAGILAAVAEGVVLAAKAGVDLEILADVLKGTGAANWHLENTFRNRVFEGDFKPGFKTRLMHKDARLAATLADELGVPMPVAALVRQIYATAVGRGLGDEDWGAITTLVEEAAGVKARYQRAAVTA
jgi:4-hydroxybutyrate dehydrogenase / sulfolactaldehyde 3-reductase